MSLTNEPTESAPDPTSALSRDRLDSYDHLVDVERLPVFVYGSLRHGQSNYWLLRGRTLQETSATIGGMVMYSLGNYPIIIDGTPPEPTSDTDGLIHGDLMLLHPQHYLHLLHNLDQLESYVPGRDAECFYRRVQRTVHTIHGHTYSAWLYIGWPERVLALQPEQIVSGDWVLFQQERLRILRRWGR